MNMTDKLTSSSSMPMIKAGGSGDGSGPTGSCRTYPKGKGSGSVSPESFNPQKAKPSTYGIGGV